MSIVSNTSPMVILSKIGLFALLKDRFKEIHIPEAVHREVLTEREGLPGSAELEAARDDWIQIHPDPPDSRLKPYLSRLGQSRADAAVLVLAQDQKAELILADNKHLRNMAEEKGFTVVGVGGILLRAKQAGLIDNVRIPLEQAQEAGYYLTEALVERILAKAGELETESDHST
jgi:predicted nucleic acid-binding protein